MAPVATDPSDTALKARHRALWTLGHYPAVATEVISALGPALVQAVGVTTGARVLDVAAGTGNAAVHAARAGADVVASDLTPELLAAGRLAAEAAGLTLRWEEADAEALPYADGAFDIVMSCVGVMFAPHHQAAADELVRVCRRGGRIGLASWTPQGFIGQMFATMRPFVPPPPPGAGAPPLWGDLHHVRGLLGSRVTDVTAERRVLEVTRFAAAADFVAFFRDHYGPTVAAFRGLAEEPERAAALEAELTALTARHLDGGRMQWEYLLLTATRI